MTVDTSCCNVYLSGCYITVDTLMWQRLSQWLLCHSRYPHAAMFISVAAIVLRLYDYIVLQTCKGGYEQKRWTGKLTFRSLLCQSYTKRNNKNNNNSYSTALYFNDRQIFGIHIRTVAFRSQDTQYECCVLKGVYYTMIRTVAKIN